MKQEKIWNKSYITLFLINLIVSTSFYMISTALSKHLVHLGMTVTMAGSVIGSMSFASMLTRPVTGWVRQKNSAVVIIGSEFFMCSRIWRVYERNVIYCVTNFSWNSFWHGNNCHNGFDIWLYPYRQDGRGHGIFRLGANHGGSHRS